MKMPGGKLRELQKHWYKILEDSGFKDIEELVNGKMVLKQTSDHSGWYKDQFNREMQEEYFRVIWHHAHDETVEFRNDVDKLILQMYANGSKIVDILRTLEEMGERRERKTVRIIIRRYEVAWDIKQYTPRQLNKRVP